MCLTIKFKFRLHGLVCYGQSRSECGRPFRDLAVLWRKNLNFVMTKFEIINKKAVYCSFKRIINEL